MYRIAVAALFLAATGCATTGGAGSREGNATVAGVIRLPESGLAQAGNPCDQLRVVVAHAATPTDALGRAMVKSSRGNRCSFTISGIPSNTDLQVSTVPDASLKCDNGSVPTITPEPSTIKMANYGTGTKDFTLSCGA
ncbi:hypothetical protein HUA74_36340 [Myxococcus sp. CA051A]|uniref:hypothetical protein n=1 Tax=unclassified Myxococcus TaxID=2648731 RepID=UPI00157A318B|nr:MULTISPECIES: hypothetical protein [unclassified Myxococcus]NTX10802.1 hypothetical protein [Myxococcus sp. CA056]NTX37310.1 hypothetical protein [Myxococcus sp. CA033]NTX57564.1 hypothetical protein [Myxococcus sp. CA039A]NTX66142.1 hypothetical protein [Myxococcus sp. CA051A]